MSTVWQHSAFSDVAERHTSTGSSNLTRVSLRLRFLHTLRLLWLNLDICFMLWSRSRHSSWVANGPSRTGGSIIVHESNARVSETYHSNGSGAVSPEGASAMFRGFDIGAYQFSQWYPWPYLAVAFDNLIHRFHYIALFQYCGVQSAAVSGSSRSTDRTGWLPCLYRLFS